MKDSTHYPPVTMPQVAYLACPYSHKDPQVMQKRHFYVNHYAAELLKQGIFVYSPLTHNLPLIAHNLPTGWEKWKMFDETMLSRCDSLIVVQLPGWEESMGVQNEIAFAKERQLPIGWLTPSAEIIASFNETSDFELHSGDESSDSIEEEEEYQKSAEESLCEPL